MEEFQRYSFGNSRGNRQLVKQKEPFSLVTHKCTAYLMTAFESGSGGLADVRVRTQTLADYGRSSAPSKPTVTVER
jgi:hypothetical protein